MKKHLLLFAMIMLPLVASAYPVEINGIYYNLISKAKQAEVTKNPIEYTGSVVIPEKVTYESVEYSVTSIGESAFYDCHKLTSITIPNSVTSIGSDAFYYCFGLTSVTIPNSVTSIGAEAFLGCSGLTSITIPNSVTSIGAEAFRGCSSLKKVIVKDIAAWCGFKFDGYESNPLSYAKHLYSDEDTEITNLIIPNSVTSIGEWAFVGCSGLTSVTIGSGVTSIGNRAFDGCSGLTSVTIPNSVTSIGNRAFYICSGLTSVIIGSGIKYIYGSAFSSCPNLTDVTCYAENVPNTDTDAFKDSYIEYANLYVPASAVNAYKAADPWKNFKSIIEVNPTGIKAIENTQIKNNTIYDLNGVRQSEPKKGINIINGKKVVIK